MSWVHLGAAIFFLQPPKNWEFAREPKNYGVEKKQVKDFSSWKLQVEQKPVTEIFEILQFKLRDSFWTFKFGSNASKLKKGSVS